MKRSLLFLMVFAILASVLLATSACNRRGDGDDTTGPVTSATTTAQATTAAGTTAAATTAAVTTTAAPVTTADNDPSVNIEDLLNPK